MWKVCQHCALSARGSEESLRWWNLLFHRSHIGRLHSHLSRFSCGTGDNTISSTSCGRWDIQLVCMHPEKWDRSFQIWINKCKNQPLVCASVSLHDASPWHGCAMSVCTWRCSRNPPSCKETYIRADVKVILEWVQSSFGKKLWLIHLMCCPSPCSFHVCSFSRCL